MNRRTLAQFEKRLLDDKTRILGKVHLSSAKQEIGSADALPDEVDQATSDLNQSIAIRLQGRERLLLNKIEKALHRIKGGHFGTCESCEEPIETKRLEARPVATLCIGCKEDQERQEQSFI